MAQEKKREKERKDKVREFDPQEAKQTNLAEGEDEIVEASLRNHERRGDLKTSTAGGGTQNR